MKESQGQSSLEVKLEEAKKELTRVLGKYENRRKLEEFIDLPLEFLWFITKGKVGKPSEIIQIGNALKKVDDLRHSKFKAQLFVAETELDLLLSQFEKDLENIE